MGRRPSVRVQLGWPWAGSGFLGTGLCVLPWLSCPSLLPPFGSEGTSRLPVSCLSDLLAPYAMVLLFRPGGLLPCFLAILPVASSVRPPCEGPEIVPAVRFRFQSLKLQLGTIYMLARKRFFCTVVYFVVVTALTGNSHPGAV